jgi:predicted PurR-regulated permease PerM
MYAIGWVATDVPYWFLLGIGTGLLSLIPYISVIGWPLALLLKYLDSLTGGDQLGWFAILVWPSVAYLVVQFIESWVLTPWIQQRSSDMNAVTLLIVLFIGGAVGGLFGLVFCIPVAACIKILIEEFLLPRWSRWAANQ